MSTSILIFGATGYIGGAVLCSLLKEFPPPKYTSTALVRSPSSHAAIEKLGVKVLKGCHSDHATIQEAASQADIVVNCADADDIELAQSIIDGMELRSGKKEDFLSCCIRGMLDIHSY